MFKRRNLKVFLVALILIASLDLNRAYPALTVTTLAGGTGTLCTTTPTLGTSLSASNVWAIAVGADGSIYYAMRSNYVVCKITSDGKVTRILGTGTSGSGTDGSSGTSFALSNPIGIGVDNAGNVYVSEYTGAYGIKKLSNTGTVTTVLNSAKNSITSGTDGLAVNAGSAGPLAIGVDANGIVYFSDYNSYTVRKIDANGYVRAVAGTGVSGNSGDGGLATAARLGSISGIEFDSSGNIYLSSWECSIRKIDITSGIITTIAGTQGVCTSTGDGGVATSATFNRPWGFAIDGSNNIFVGGRGDCSIRKIAAVTGIVSTVAGLIDNCGDTNSNPIDSRFGYIYDLAVSPFGDLIIEDMTYGKIKVISGFATPTISPSVSISAPSSTFFRSTTLVTATVSQAGRVTFLSNGKRIAGCINLAVTSTVTCNWKPASRGELSIQALVSVSGMSASSNEIKVVVKNRVTTR